MRHTDHSPGPEDAQARELAARWFARMHSGEATREDRQAFEAWLAQDPEHGRHYRNLGVFWDATLDIPEDRLRSLMAPPPAASIPAMAATGRSQLSRRLFMGLAGGCALALIATAGLSFWRDPVRYQAEFATAQGERRQISLPDGSLIDLNTATRLTVKLQDSRREVLLHQGEALFTVSSDPQRSFVVDGGLGTVSVTGTRFNVRHEPAQMQVVVESGSVRVRSGHWWNAQTHDLVAGQGIGLGDGPGLGVPYAVNASNALAWQRGKIIFENQPLAQAVKEVNRYLERPLLLEPGDLTDKRYVGYCQGPLQCYFGQGRVVLATLRYRW